MTCGITNCGRPMPTGGSRGSPRAPTRNTSSRSFRWRRRNSTGSVSVLDLGCGDGQISRLLAASGARVVGVDPTWNQIRVAHERGGGAAYARSEAAELPFADAAFDAAVACLVFEHIDDVDGAIAEVARVLRPGGQFSFFLNHPLLQTPGSGWIDDHTIDPPEQYWRIGPYLVEQDSVEQVEQGVFIRFVHRPLSRYLNALCRARPRPRTNGRAGPTRRLSRPRLRIRRSRRHPAPAVSPPPPHLTLLHPSVR